MQEKPKPLFLLSLPRAGSTLLQRILTAHPKIYSVAEPWILLPLFYSFRSDQVYTEFDYPTYKRALTDFCNELPGGEQEYRREIALAVERMYESLSPAGTTYFLDKTPRYSLIAEDLLSAFPDAKFILMWRNPLAVAASMIESFARGNWNLHYFRIDLYEGLDMLCDVSTKYPERFHILQYEQLLTNSETETQRLYAHLGLENVPEALDSFQKVDFRGRMGDPTGRKAYKNISGEPLGKWKTTFANPLRRRWLERYLEWLGRRRIELMGYDYEFLRSEVSSISLTQNARKLPSDILRMSYGRFEPYLNSNILRRRFKGKTKDKPLSLLR